LRISVPSNCAFGMMITVHFCIEVTTAAGLALG
jgi:hypothetical protein